MSTGREGAAAVREFVAAYKASHPDATGDEIFRALADSDLDVRGLVKAKKAILPPARTEHYSYCQTPREPGARCANCGPTA